MGEKWVDGGDEEFEFGGEGVVGVVLVGNVVVNYEFDVVEDFGVVMVGFFVGFDEDGVWGVGRGGVEFG